MLIIVGSENPTKINAVKQAFTKIFPENSWKIAGVAVESGVSNQPMSDKEAIIGATNRATKALLERKADFGVGLEGGIQEINGQWFESGWAVVIDAKGQKGIGSTLKVLVPSKLMALIKQGTELGVANDIIFKTKNSKHADGHFGLMTNNAITRTEGYRDGVISALSRFIHAELF